MGMAQELANKYIAQYETRNPFEICKKLGIYVMHHDLLDVRGYCAIASGNEYVVLSSGLSDPVGEYVCSHELGHLCLHRGLNRVFMDSRTFMVPDKYENEADQFAVSLLYSDYPVYDDRELTDWELADCLNVPICGLYSRMIYLGMKI